MVIIGGLGTIMGSFLEPDFISAHADLPRISCSTAIFGQSVDASVISAVEQVVFGVMIIMFLIFEPLGLARLWQLLRRDCGSGRSSTRSNSTRRSESRRAYCNIRRN